MKIKDIEYSKIFTDMMKEGFIAIDKGGIIQVYNDRAREIFGIKNKFNISHPSGRLEEGDIIVIGNNSFGDDDGKMDGNSLKLLGLEAGDIKKGEAFLLISRYKSKNIDYLVSKEKYAEISLEEKLLDRHIKLKIDFMEKLIRISLDGENIDLNYLTAIGHMLVLDGKTGGLKFYQAHGYTAKKESINDLLKGASYMAKGENSDNLQLIGENIFSIHSSKSLIKDFFRLARGENINWVDKYEDINGYPTLCTLKPIEYDKKRLGAALIVEDISEIKKIREERDSILKELEEASRIIEEKDRLDKFFPDFIGEDDKIIEVKKMALRAANTGSNILLAGGVGVGKALLSRSIHRNSRYSRGRYCKIDGRNFKMEYLNLKNFKGTIYINGVENLDLESQAGIYELLEAGYNYDDIRFIFSTSKNLDQMLIQGEFDERLYYKINIFPINIPNLRDRKSDIRLLVDHMLPEICRRAKTDLKRLSNEAMQLLMSYDWPDNVRELENVLERAVNYSFGDNILTEHIILYNTSREMGRRNSSLKSLLEEREKLIIERCLFYHNGDKKKAMRELQISQSSFYEKLKKYNIK